MQIQSPAGDIPSLELDRSLLVTLFTIDWTLYLLQTDRLFTELGRFKDRLLVIVAATFHHAKW